MIKTFASKEVEKLFQREISQILPIEIQGKARQKLEILDAAESPDDLQVSPGDPGVQHNMHIDQQWRICFQWKDGDCYEVEIMDSTKQESP